MSFAVSEMLIKHLPALVIALPLLAAFLIPLINKIGNESGIGKYLRNAFVVLAVLINSFLCFLLSAQIHKSGAITYVMGGLKSALTLPSGNILPIRIILNVDGFGVLMAVSCSIIAVGVIIYSLMNMNKCEQQSKYYALGMLIIAGINGIVMTGDLFNLFVFVEILSIAITIYRKYNTLDTNEIRRLRA